MFKQKFFRQIWLYLLLIVISVIIIFPIFWMLSSSLKPLAVFSKYPPEIFPTKPTLENYKVILTEVPFIRFVLNSLFVAVATVLGRVFVCSLAAYAFARLRFRGRDALFLVFLATMMIPYAVIMIPLYVLMMNIGWVDTFAPLIIPSALTYTYGTFLLRQFFKTIPLSIEDSARIDGCNPFQIYYKIMLPQVKPALSAIAVFSFVWSWNLFLIPLIYLSDTEKYTIGLGLNLIQQTWPLEWGYLMASSFLAIVPTMIIFLSMQRYFVKSIVLSGLHG